MDRIDTDNRKTACLKNPREKRRFLPIVVRIRSVAFDYVHADCGVQKVTADCADCADRSEEQETTENTEDGGRWTVVRVASLFPRFPRLFPSALFRVSSFELRIYRAAASSQERGAITIKIKRGTEDGGRWTCGPFFVSAFSAFSAVVPLCFVSGFELRASDLPCSGEFPREGSDYDYDYD